MSYYWKKDQTLMEKMSTLSAMNDQTVNFGLERLIFILSIFLEENLKMVVTCKLILRVAL